MTDSTNDPRLTAIKTEGKARRVRRQRRNAGLIALALIIVVGGGTLAFAGGNHDTAPEAARDVPTRCQNSTDATCGPFQWNPEPARNQPLAVTLRVAPDPGTVSQPVTATVIWADPDGPRADLISECWGDSPCEPPPPPCATRTRAAAGTWAPPRRHPGHGKLVLGPHSYSSSGTYSILVTVASRSWPDNTCPPSGDPYANTKTVRTVVTIR